MIKEGNVKMTAKEFYETFGQNYEEVLERLAGSEALVLKFLKKFSTDKTYAALEEAKEAESAAGRELAAAQYELETAESQRRAAQDEVLRLEGAKNHYDLLMQSLKV